MSEARAPAHARLRPLTERILGRLPGPNAVWIIVWALVPWVNRRARAIHEWPIDDGTVARVITIGRLILDP